MNAEEAVRMAVDYGHRAEAEEKAQNFGEAFRHYKQALFLYFVAAREIRVESSGYLQRTHEFIRFLGAKNEGDCLSASATPSPTGQPARLLSSGSNLSVFPL
ncbi:hypothetical protein HPB51_010488 [Rhipicephalus microplus]|uniref:Uncharacterized protein n=1 Tax=Rhipicephalus microplus TaxID=6941 RepID=A0A9J6E0W0_RHIMP|nr:hypothetical protein HPB51_010488 [Rhipicephalus microplus]